MKKILTSLTLAASIATLSAQVVSCGPATFRKLAARHVDPTVYKGSFAAPMTSWSAVTSQTASDSWILTNANDMLIAPNQYNNFEGDLADNWDHVAYSGADPNATYANQDYRSWAFHVRSGENAPVWTKLNKEGGQEVVRAIAPRDFFNTYRYIFNPNNISQTVGVWQQIIDYGSDLYNFLTYIRTAPKAWPNYPDSEHPYPSLYDPRFARDNDPGMDNGIVQSSFFIDRAILFFNMHPARANDLAGMEEIKRQALDVTMPYNGNFDSLGDQVNALVQESFDKGKIINSGDGINFNLAYNLLKPAEYFESIASFLSFSPVPDEAVDYLNIMHANMAGTNYGSAKVTGEFGYNSIYYSGAYVVSDYNPSLKLVMTKNKFYFNRDNVPIKTLSYSFTGNVDISRQRFYFETGDLSEFMISSSDLAGWNKYVGDDFNNPRFEGTNIVSRPQAGTQALFINFNSTRSEPQTEAANQALAQRSARAFLRYVFDRSEVSRFYSKARDGLDPTSHNLRNTWTAPNVGLWNDAENQTIDYVKFLYQDYMKLPTDDPLQPPPSDKETIVDWLKEKLLLDEAHFNAWDERFGSAQTTDESGAITQASSWIDGFDPYLRNDLLGAYTFIGDDRDNPNGEPTSGLLEEYVPLIGDYSDSAEAQKLTLIEEQVRQDLATKQIATTPIDVVFLANGATGTGINNYIKSAVQTFNFRVGGNSPIRLQVVESKDASEYSSMLDSGLFSIIVFGWISDYADPYGFLHAMVYGGDLAEYAGFSRLFKTTANGDLIINDSIDNPTAYEDLRRRVQYFTNQSGTIDLTVPNSPERYLQMATVENYGILESMITIPMFTQYLDDVPYVSYVDPFTRTTFASGSPIYRFVGVRMVDQLWDHATFNSQKAKYERERNEYKSKYPGSSGKLITVKNGDWRASNS